MRNPRKRTLREKMNENPLIVAMIVLIGALMILLMAPPILKAFGSGKSTVPQTVGTGQTKLDRNYGRYPDYPTASEEALEMRKAARELEIREAKQKAEAEALAAKARAKALAEKKAATRKKKIAAAPVKATSRSTGKSTKASPVPVASNLSQFASRSQLSRGEVNQIVANLAIQYGVSGSTGYLQRACQDIIWDGHHESSGNCRAVGPPDAFGDRHRGLLQFNSQWGSVAQRNNPVWSLGRLVNGYANAGGTSFLRRHWAATLGR